MKKLFFPLALLAAFGVTAQSDACYWQQQVDYKMEIDMDVKTFKFKGDQELVYTNNSPDTLKRVFYHLYFNAFQPGSEMDIRLQNIADPDGRMVNNLGTREEPEFQSRISLLKPDQIGYIKVGTLTQDGKAVSFTEAGTVLEVDLVNPLAPGASTTLDMKFEGQVPEQIRRSGRNNADGVALSMTQWYPKLAEYDFEGWHAHPYIAREFHGVWGDFSVKISIDKNYIIGGTGVLQNASEIGYGYEEKGTKVKRKKGNKLTWHFVAEKVHDFAWAADPEYIHDKLETESGVTLHFLYKNDPKVKDNWKAIQPMTAEVLKVFNEHIGPYPWPQYSVIQGGDGGMEYAMATLITGGEDLDGLWGTTVHELAHSWFQQLLATNESQHPWMDEGFTSYISAVAHNQMSDNPVENPWTGSYRGYTWLAGSGIEQPMTTHGDRYTFNRAYSIASYTKGAVFLSQLNYLIGKENVRKTLKRYYDEWKFKHPTPNDFIRVAEKVSGAELSWYLNDWTRTTNTVDYALSSVEDKGGVAEVSLERIGLIPMPIELKITYTDDTREKIYIPLRLMRWEKTFEGENVKQLEDWTWAAPTYSFTLNKPKSAVKSIVIDEIGLMADVNRDNNIYGEAIAED